MPECRAEMVALAFICYGGPDPPPRGMNAGAVLSCCKSHHGGLDLAGGMGIMELMILS